MRVRDVAVDFVVHVFVAWVCVRLLRSTTVWLSRDPACLLYRHREKGWQPGERCRMYVGGKQGAKISGSWYKGKVIHVGQPAAPDHQDFDPWESVVVEWDRQGLENTQARVSVPNCGRCMAKWSC